MRPNGKKSRKFAVVVLCGVIIVLASDKLGISNVLLRQCAASDFRCLVRVLTCIGADVNSLDGDGRTALFEAAVHGNVEMARLLLKSGANPLIVDVKGETALGYSLHSKPTEGIKMDKLLVHAGCLKRQKSPLLSMNTSRMSSERVSMLIANGADPNEDDGEAFRQFSLNRNTDVVSILFTAGADINRPGRDGSTALSLAVEHGNADTVKFLISHGAFKGGTYGGKSLLDIARAQRAHFAKYGAPAVAEYDRIIVLLEAQPFSVRSELSPGDRRHIVQLIN